MSGALVLTGCAGPTMGDLPLPGSGVPGDTITVTMEFEEALNLAQGATVKVNGVDSGRVQTVTAKDFRALATMKVRRSAQLRKNATVRLRYTTPLGELFVDVANPERGELLQDKALFPRDRTETAPTVEDALSESSLLINGGGLAQLQTITEELNNAVGGREDTVRSLLSRSNTFLTEANATTADIGRALDALNRLSTELESRTATINSAIKEIRPAAKVLRENTPGLTRLLIELEKFSATANNVVGATREQILHMIRQVTPVLQEFLSVRSDFGPSLDDLVSLGKKVEKSMPGDYGNLRLELEMSDLTLPGGAKMPHGAGFLGDLTGVLGSLGPLLGLGSMVGGQR